VLENRVLRKKIEPKRDEVIGEWRKIHNEFNDLYCSPNIIRLIKLRITWAGHVACMWEGRFTYRALRGRFEGKSPPGRYIHRWSDIIKVDLE
jgi:hypothetical protein